MSVSSIRALIYAVVNNVADVGLVYDYFRWSKDRTTLYDLYKTTVDSVAQLRGGGLTFLGYDQEQRSIGRNDKNIVRLYHWRFDYYMGLDDSAATEKTFSNEVEAICESLDGSTSLNTASVCLYREPTDCVVDEVLFAGNLCHHAAITFDIAEDAGKGRYLFYDTFTDDDSTTLPNHTPDVDRKGNGWTGSATISGNMAIFNSLSYADVEESDCTVEVAYGFGNIQNRTAKIILRYTGANDYDFVQTDLNVSGTGTFDFVERVSGVETTRATTAVTTKTGNGYVYRVVLNGASVACEFLDTDGETVLYRIVYGSATSNQSGTGYGCLLSGAAGFDDFKVYWSASDD